MPYTIPLLTSPSSSSSTPAESNNDSSNIYQLLEIPASLLAHFTPSSSSSSSTTQLTIKGQPSDSAVLTTSTSTYTLRSVSQSNSLLLCSLQPSPPRTVKGERDGVELVLQSTVLDTLECQLSIPNLGRITSLLRPCRYTDRSPPNPDVKLYTRQEVHDLVQSSDVEITQGLVSQHVIELDGFLRQLDDEFTLDLLKAVLVQVEVNAYLLENVPLHEVVEALEREFGYEADAVRQVCNMLFGKEEEGGVTSLNRDKVLAFVGRQTLKMARTPMPLSTFFAHWRNHLSSTLHPHLSLTLLRSEYLLHPSPSPLTPTTSTLAPPFTIQRFSIADLPLSPAARFQDLFTTRSSWTAEDLEPFLHDLTGDGEDADGARRKEALLLKFCRASRAKIPDWSEHLQPYYRSISGVEQDAMQGGARVNAKTKEVTMYTARVKY